MIVILSTQHKKRFGAAIVAHYLNLLKGNSCILCLYRNGGYSYVSNENDIVLRWGCEKKYDFPLKLDVNPQINILISRQKYLCRTLFKENDVNCPTSTDEISEIKQYPVIARPDYHYQGRHFYICNDQETAQRFYDIGQSKGVRYYFQEVIDKEKEFRLHVLMNEVFAAYEKPLGETMVANQSNTGLKWIKIEPDDVLIDLAIRACQALGLQHGAVDLYLSKEGDYGVFEVNTNPEIKTKELAMIYAQQLLKHL